MMVQRFMQCCNDGHARRAQFDGNGRGRVYQYWVADTFLESTKALDAPSGRGPSGTVKMVRGEYDSILIYGAGYTKLASWLSGVRIR